MRILSTASTVLGKRHTRQAPIFGFYRRLLRTLAATLSRRTPPHPLRTIAAPISRRTPPHPLRAHYCCAPKSSDTAILADTAAFFRRIYRERPFNLRRIYREHSPRRVSREHSLRRLFREHFSSPLITRALLPPRITRAFLSAHIPCATSRRTPPYSGHCRTLRAPSLRI
jgi:hypothetical protein